MYTRGTLAKEAGITGEAIRFYENRGLLAEPTRNESGYRTYSEEDLIKVTFIKRAKDLGFSLKEIAELMELRVNPRGGCNGVRQQAQTKVQEIQEKVRDLNRMKKALTDLIHSCEARSPTGDCPIIQSLNQR